MVDFVGQIRKITEKLEKEIISSINLDFCLFEHKVSFMFGKSIVFTL